MRQSRRAPAGGSDPVYRCRQPSVRRGLGPASTPASFSAWSAPAPWGSPAQARGSKEVLLLPLWWGAGSFGCGWPRGPCRRLFFAPWLVHCRTQSLELDGHRVCSLCLSGLVQSPDWEQVVHALTLSSNKAASSGNVGGCLGQGWAAALTGGSSLAGLVHRDLRLGDLPPQSFHSLPLSQSGPFPDGGLRYGGDRLLGSVQGAWDFVHFTDSLIFSRNLTNLNF